MRHTQIKSHSGNEIFPDLAMTFSFVSVNNCPVKSCAVSLGLRNGHVLRAIP